MRKTYHLEAGGADSGQHLFGRGQGGEAVAHLYPFLDALVLRVGGLVGGKDHPFVVCKETAFLVVGRGKVGGWVDQARYR